MTAAPSLRLISEVKCQEIRFDEDPKVPCWNLVPIFKISKKTGRGQIWQIGFDGVDRLHTSSGQINGKMRITDKLIVPKVKRDMQAQALQQARHKFDGKFKKGYRPRGSEVPVEFEAMVPENYINKKKSDLVNRKFVYLPIPSYPVAVQPKLDGIRVIGEYDAKTGHLDFLTRAGTHYKHLTHLEPELLAFLGSLPEGTKLDGELYWPGHTFNEITSVVKAEVNVKDRVREIQLFIFDIWWPGEHPYDERYVTIVQAYRQYIQNGGQDTTFKIITCSFAYGHEDIISFHDQYVALKYEGVIIRKMANGAPPGSKGWKESLYQEGRTSNILKFKAFFDEEVTVTGVEEGEGIMEGAAIFNVTDDEGRPFKVRMEGPIAKLQEYWQHPERVIGRRLTIRYQEVSEYGVPRFPIGQAFRDYE